MTLKRKASLHATAEEANTVLKKRNLLQHPSEDADVVMYESLHDEVHVPTLDASKDPSHHPQHPVRKEPMKIDIPITYAEYSSAENSPTSSPFYPDYFLYPNIDN